MHLARLAGETSSRSHSGNLFYNLFPGLESYCRSHIFGPQPPTGAKAVELLLHKNASLQTGRSRFVSCPSLTRIVDVLEHIFQGPFTKWLNQALGCAHCQSEPSSQIGVVSSPKFSVPQEATASHLQKWQKMTSLGMVKAGTSRCGKSSHFQRSCF